MRQKKVSKTLEITERWIDVHSHLNFLEISPQEALAHGRSVGVERLITIGTTPDDHEVVLDLANTLGPEVYCTLGVHPHEASLFNDEVGQNMRSQLQQDKVLGVGEIGLDYYYEHSPREIQREAFRSQLQIALETNMPVEIHTRDAEEDTINILKEFGAKIRGLVHCFTGSLWLAEESLRLGLDISFSGVVTFKSAGALREVCQVVPLERLHVETDCPYLAPVPERGKKNEPAFVVHTARVVAELKGISMAKLSEQTCRNALRLFPKLRWES